jgi:serine/threonine protein kinase
MHILSREPSLITSDRKMGCVGSSLDCREDIERSCRRTNSETVNDTIACYNEQEIDSSHFIISKKLLGVGGFGLVRLAFKGTGDDKSRPYALKTMSKAAVLKRNSGIPAIMTELHALILLNNHPFICNAKYAFQDMSFLYLVLDLVPGGDMRYNIRQAPNNKFSESVAKFYIAQVLIAVDACHKSNILHRDVKPENILMGVDGYLKLSDFGVAKILPDIEDCRSTSGTHGYMAPEIYRSACSISDQSCHHKILLLIYCIVEFHSYIFALSLNGIVRPTHKHGTAADWFAVGITLHEFVCGRRPFESSRLQRFRASDQDALTTDFLNSRDDLSPVCKYFIQDLLHPQVQIRKYLSLFIKHMRTYTNYILPRIYETFLCH